jgi:glycosyltransferase involved in cell wall biosynthesis
VNAPRRVVHLSTGHSVRDVRIFLKECRTLATAGYEVHFIAQDDGRNVQGGLRDGVRTWHVEPPRGDSRLARMTSTMVQVSRRARSLNADVYHVHDPELVPAALLLARSGALAIYDVHEEFAATVHDKPWLPARLRPLIARAVATAEPAAANRLAAVVAATPAIARQFEGCRCEVATVHNYPELGEFAPARPARDGPPEPVVCCVGVLSAMRGAEVMVDAIAQTNARLLLAGVFESSELEARLRAKPGWAQVDFLGLVGRAQIAEVFARATVGVHMLQPAANHYRSLPTKLFEYMAAGLPVVVSDFPYWRDIVEPIGCGICVDPQRPAALAEAIRWLGEHPEEARTMGENGRRAAHETYNWHREGERLLDLYRSLLAARG